MEPQDERIAQSQNELRGAIRERPTRDKDALAQAAGRGECSHSPEIARGLSSLAMPEELKPDDPAVHEETDNSTYADDRMFYKVEKWTRDGAKVDRMLYAGNSLGRARSVFESAIKHRPRIRLTIRQLTRVLQQWPE